MLWPPLNHISQRKNRRTLRGFITPPGPAAIRLECGMRFQARRCRKAQRGHGYALLLCSEERGAARRAPQVPHAPLPRFRLRRIEAHSTRRTDSPCRPRAICPARRHGLTFVRTGLQRTAHLGHGTNPTLWPGNGLSSRLPPTADEGHGTVGPSPVTWNGWPVPLFHVPVPDPSPVPRSRLRD